MGGVQPSGVDDSPGDEDGGGVGGAGSGMDGVGSGGGMRGVVTGGMVGGRVVVSDGEVAGRGMPGCDCRCGDVERSAGVDGVAMAAGPRGPEVPLAGMIWLGEPPAAGT